MTAFSRTPAQIPSNSEQVREDTATTPKPTGDRTAALSRQAFTGYPDKYESWWGITTLPNVKENNPEYTEYICGENGILQKWIDNGARGWRLDVADELPDEFLDNLNKAVKAKGDDKVIYGESGKTPPTRRATACAGATSYGGQLDSVMNYPFKEAILNYVQVRRRQRRSTDGSYDDPRPLPQAQRIDMLMNFLSTHDTERAP